MIFDDWESRKKEKISKEILWEYDIEDPNWNWEKMKNIVVQRVLENGREQDYYAMFQIYGGKTKVREIIKNMPFLGPRELSWACVLFNLKKEELRCYTRQQLRKKI